MVNQHQKRAHLFNCAECQELLLNYDSEDLDIDYEVLSNYSDKKAILPVEQ